MIKKNDVITAEIVDYSSDGNGVAKYNDIVIFVPFSAVGDLCDIKIVKVLSGYCFGIIERIIRPSTDRITPVCPISKQCGGCDFQHISYDAEKKAKENFVRSAFERIGKIKCDVMPTLSCDKYLRYRNKAQFPIQTDENGKASTGFYARRSHRVIKSDDCVLQPVIFNEIASFIVEMLNKYNIKPYDEHTQKGIVRHVYLRKAQVTGQIMLCLVCTQKNFKNCDELIFSVKDKFPEITTIVININNKFTNVVLGNENEVVYGNGKITDFLCGVEIEISPHSFYQVNHDGAEQLYGIAKKSLELTTDDILLDMYCGTGSIGLSMADSIKALVGVEIIPQAVENAKINAEKHGIKNARFICADAKEAANRLLNEGFVPTAVVVDPPRKGCDEDTLNAIIKMSVPKISMISCNPSTAARDCKYLCEHGYDVKFVQPFDMFPRTKHVETVVQLVRKKPDTYIDITVDMDELDLTSSEAKATYDEIKDYIFDKHCVKVSSLYVAQVKQKHGIIERDCYNNSKKENPNQPQCPPEKAKLIEEALRHFKMIP